MEIATSHGDIADTFLSKIKKWQMAYSNYISWSLIIVEAILPSI